MKTYIIHLSNNNFSVKMANETIESLEFLNIEYELFDGVKGNEGKNILSKYKRYPSTHVNKWEEGTIGCLASHYVLWDRCARQNEPFLILEQDADLMSVLPMPPGKSCYMGGWIVPPLIKTSTFIGSLSHENVIITKAKSNFFIFL